MSWFLAVGPVALTVMFSIRSVRPVIDPTLLGFAVVLLAATVGTILANRIAAGVLALLAAAMFQPIVARDLSFSLASIDSGLWQAWAVITIVATGSTLITALVVLVRRPIGGTAQIVASLVGVGIGVALLGVFPMLSDQRTDGSDLDAEQIAGLAEIVMVNYAYGLPATGISSTQPTLVKLVNPSGLPHTLTIDSLDLDAFVPAERWTIIEIDPTRSTGDALTIICTIDDHLALGMSATLDAGT